MRLGLLLLTAAVLRPTALRQHLSPRVQLEAMLGVVFVVPVVAPEVAVVRRVLATLADPLMIAMFERLKLPRRLRRSTMTHPLSLLMILSWQN